VLVLFVEHAWEHEAAPLDPAPAIVRSPPNARQIAFGLHAYNLVLAFKPRTPPFSKCVHLHCSECATGDFLDGMNIQVQAYVARVFILYGELVYLIFQKTVCFIDCTKRRRPRFLFGAGQRPRLTVLLRLPDEGQPFQGLTEAGVIKLSCHIHAREQDLFLPGIDPERQLVDKRRRFILLWGISHSSNFFLVLDILFDNRQRRSSYR
jgi:hypothetical protein